MPLDYRMEKPFICSQNNCKMTFTNEDHLEVHKRCHEIEMSQQGSTNVYPTFISSKLPIFVIDQTPTPTNCLKHCEDVSLFHDITLNPFDEEFRKASQLKTQLSIPDNSAADSLETPKIPPMADSDETISSTSKDVSSCSISYPNGAPSSSASGTRNHTAGTHDETPVENDGKGKMRLTINVLPTSESQTNTKLTSTPTPVITAGPSVSQNLASNETCRASECPEECNHSGVNAGCSYSVNESDVDPLSKGITKYSTAGGDQCGDTERGNLYQNRDNLIQSNTNPVVPSSPATVLQLVLRLPNGQSIPVEIPATPVVSSAAFSKGVVTVAQTNASLMSNSSVPCQSSGNNGSSIAKMKLKQVLTSCSTAAKPGITKFSRANTANRIAQMTRSCNSSDSFYSDVNSTMSDLEGSHFDMPSGSHPKRRRDSSDSDDPLQRRRKFLERNRVAAVRCREKKKEFVKNLFVKSDELESINQKLQNEVCTLRSEVALLKSLLLQHKDCPVTLAMQNDNLSGEEYPKSFTTFKIQQPSGVITQITTTPVTNISPQSQPDDALQDSVPAAMAQAIEGVVSHSKIIVSPHKLGQTEVAKPRTVPIAPVIVPTPQGNNNSSLLTSGGIILPDNVCLPSSVSSSNTVILVNTSTSGAVKSSIAGGSNPTFIITKPAVSVKRNDANEITPRCNSLPSASQRILSLDTSVMDHVYTTKRS